jgi:tetratricopeptide (TPR) repeat protein
MTERMRRWLGAAAAAALLALLSACAPGTTIQQVAQDTWIEARTPNFVVLTNAGEARARYLAQNLEDFRRLVIAATSLDIESNPRPFHIVALSTTGQLRALIDTDQVFGAFQQSYRGGLAVVNLTARAPDGTDSLEVTYTPYGPLYRAKQNTRTVGMDGVFHEYVHYLLEIDAGRRYPLWFHEGYAEYLSTFDVMSDGRYKVGAPPMHRVVSLEKARWIPLGALFNARGYETGHENGDFNAQSWLAVHYLMSDPDRRQRLYRFLDRLNRPTLDTVPVFEEVFEMTVEQAGRQMRQYRRAGRFEAEKFERPPSPLPEPAIRTLPADEAKEQLAYTLLHFSPARQKGITLLDEAIAANPENARAVALLAAVALAEGDETRAQSIVDGAATLAQRSPELLGLRGELALRRAARQFTENDSRWSAALAASVEDYRRALALDPQEAQALVGLARTWLIHAEPPPPEAVALLDRAQSLLPTNHDITLIKAHLLLRRREIQAAVDHYEKVVAWSRDPALVRQARERLDAIEAVVDGYLEQQRQAAP